MDDLKATLLRKFNLSSFSSVNYGYWNAISNHRYLTEDFIREFKRKVNWRLISAHQKLSESFILEFKSYIDWGHCSLHQNLSRDFILKHKSMVLFHWLPQFVNCSPTIDKLLIDHKLFLEDISNEIILSYYLNYKLFYEFDLTVLPKDIHTEVLAVCKL
jgi:hypothetical protein